jgi:peptidoglycan/LPS O-acetylase OafA/YrhL
MPKGAQLSSRMHKVGEEMTGRTAVQPGVADLNPGSQRALEGVTGPGTRLAWLDVLRGWAALCVVFNHFGYFVPSSFNAAVYQWVNPGDYGVFVFFIISGYIVPASLERRSSVRTFWVSRIFRLYPLYLLAVGFAVALWAVHAGSLRGEGTNPGTSVLSQLLMMSNVLGGQNLPNVVWSLSYEMIFYLLLTALFAARLHRRSSRYALAFALAAVAVGGLLPQAYFDKNLGAPHLVALVADAVVLSGLVVAVVFRGLPRLAGAAVAMVTGLTLLAFNGTWLPPWEALSIMALMFTGTMLYRADQGQYPWRRAISVAVSVLGLAIWAGLWHAHANLVWDRRYAISVAAAGLTFAVGLAFRDRTWPRVLTWLGLISYSVYLLHPTLIEACRHLPWIGRHHSLWPQLLIDASFLATLIALCSLTYLYIERPMQNAGRRLARWFDARFGPDHLPDSSHVPQPASAAYSQSATE